MPPRPPPVPPVDAGPTAPPAAPPEQAAARHAAMLAQLQRPRALAGWAGAVSLVQTHISSLLMAGDRVYKLKRPVNFGFLDFSTLAAREAACREELRLNQRTAPALYLAVLPVRAGPAGAGAAISADPAPRPAPPGDGPGQVIDWAVQMHRFDADQGFDRLAASGRLQPAMVDALAAALAHFHAGLPPAPARFGQPDDTRACARTNLAELAALVADQPALARRVAALAAWTEARGAALAGLMAQRHRDGLVREVHGDLHLGNVVWHAGAPLLFDALEFSAALRHTDTVGDLAFMAMDLMAQGLPGLAWRFVNATLDASGDHDALPLLPWWAVHRALVRAKVARLGQPAVQPAGQGTPWPATAERYLAVAEALATGAGATSPRLVQMMGLSGSGKSVVAGALAEQLPGVRLRADVLRKRLFGLAPTARAPASLGLYSPQANQRTYARLAAVAAAALAAGLNVVVDAASLRRDERASLAALAQRHGARYTLLLCTAPAPVLAARVAQRAAAEQDASDATAAVLARQQQRVQWPGDDEAAATLVLDTDAPRAQVAAQACASLAPALRPGAGG